MTGTAQIVLVFGAGFLAAILLFYVVQVARRMRAVLAVKLKRAALGYMLGVLAGFLCRAQRCSPGMTVIITLAAIISPLWLIKMPRRSRYIPAQVKRAVIARSGIEDYDSERYHFDHLVPLAKNGDTSIENLRLTTKETNLKKGAKMPRLKDFL